MNEYRIISFKLYLIVLFQNCMKKTVLSKKFVAH